mgnify:CR=1 FL=1
MSFWVTQDYFVKIDSLNPMVEIYGGCLGFDTYVEAFIYMVNFNSSVDRVYDDEICGPPCRTYLPRGSEVKNLLD